MNNILKYTIATLSVVFFISCNNGKPQQQQAMGPMPLTVMSVKKQDAVINKEYSVNLEGQQNVEIRPKVSGFIQKIYVDEGQPIKKGELLFKLETATLSQDAAAAKARVNVAEVEVNRLIPLVERNIISAIQLETAKANLAQVKSTYNSIMATINYANITSPVNGVIGSIPYREGSLVSSTITEPLTTVSDAKMVRAYFSMNEKELLDFTRTYEGQTMQEKINNIPEVSLSLIDKSIYEHKGKIETISGLINQRTGSTECRAIFPNPNGILRSGGSGLIKIPFVEEDIFLIPQIAVSELQGKHRVFIVGENNKVSSRVLEINGTSELNYIISSGLNEGELVVVEGVSKLIEGQEISPKKQ